MLKNLLTFFLLFVPVVLFAQESVSTYSNDQYQNVPDEKNLLAGNDQRSVIDLNGTWKVKYGSDEQWKDILIPSSIDYNGIITFKRQFFLPENINDFHLKLRALSINNICLIRINGFFIGRHYGAFTSFELDILESVLLPGNENNIEIEVDGSNSFSSPVLPRPLPWGWKNYSGIIRELFFEILPKVSLSDMSIKYQLDDTYTDADVQFTFSFQNYSQMHGGREDTAEIKQEDIREIGYYVEVFNEDTRVLAKSTAANPKFFNIYMAFEDTMMMNFRDVDKWSPENPTKYRVVVTLIKRSNIVVDRFEMEFGFRGVEFKADGLFINGKKQPYYGIYRIEQHPDYGVSLPYRVILDDLLKIKDLGINLIRTGPYPNHPYLYDICDDLGILILEEIPFSNVPSNLINNPAYVDHGIALVEEMIKRDIEHPSILAWGIGSSLDISSDETAEYVFKVARSAKALDNRPLYYSTMLTDFDKAISYVDFKLFDMFSPEISNIIPVLSQVRKMSGGVPVFIGRIGGAIDPVNLSGYQDPKSISYQAKYLGDVFEYCSQSNEEIIIGSFADWRGDVPALFNGVNSDSPIYFGGLVTEKRLERPAYSQVKSLISNSQSITLSIGDKPLESQRSIIFMGFGIILLFIVLLKQDRWFGQNFKRSLFSAKIFFEDIYDRRNINTFQTILLASIICAGISVGVAGYAFFFKENVYFDLIISQFFTGESIKQVVITLIFSPVLNILVLTFMGMTAIIVISFFHGFYLSTTGIRRGFSTSLNLIVWSASHGVILIPLSMAMYATLQASIPKEFYFYTGMFFIFVFLLRLAGAFKVALGRKYIKGMFAFIVILILLLGSVIFYYENMYKSLTYANHFLSIAQAQGF